MRLAAPAVVDGIGPELVLRGRHVDRGVGEDRRVGVLGHQAADVIGVEVRDDDGVDLGRIDAGCLPDVVLGDVAGRRRQLRAGAGVEQHQLALGPDGRDREGDRHVRIGQPAGLERGLDLIQRRVLDEARIVRLLPDAVVHLDDLDVADLELDDALGRLLRERRREELQRPVEPESGSRLSPPKSRSRDVRCSA